MLDSWKEYEGLGSLYKVRLQSELQIESQIEYVDRGISNFSCIFSGLKLEDFTVRR